jgi:glycerophosphoryl diester phosphodiesterase
VRGAAALALARHDPDIAAKAIPTQLKREMKEALKLDSDYIRRGKPQLVQAEIDEIMGHFRAQMKMVQAISMLKGPQAIQALEQQVFRQGAGEDFAQMNGLVSAFQLWDRIGLNAQPAVQALESTDITMADRAEWMLVQGGPVVLPEVRRALGSQSDDVRERAIRIVAWQGDTKSLETLRAMQKTNTKDAIQAAWAIEKIESLHPKL